MVTKIVRATKDNTWNVLGLPHTVLVDHVDNPSGYEIVEITGPPGAGVPPHVHTNEDETFYVAAGEAVFTVEGRESLCSAGAAANLPRGVPHSFRIVAPATRLLLTIVPGRLAPMFKELAALPPGAPDLEAVARICRRYDIEFV